MTPVATPPQIQELENRHAASPTVGPEIAPRVLRILEWRDPDQNMRTCYVTSPATGGYLQLPMEEKLQFEIASWVNALKQALNRTAPDTVPLQRLSPTLHSLCQSRPSAEWSEALARTLRMMLLLEAMLLETSPSDQNAYAMVFEGMRPDLNDLVATVKATTRPLDDSAFDPRWHVPLVLLLIVAVAESQCEHAQPFTWEAYSAGRAYDDLKKQWGELPPSVSRTVALLIRCQSAVGQFQRKTAGGRLLNWVRQTAPETGYLFDDLIAALKVLAIVEEARNRSLPGSRPEGRSQSKTGAHPAWDQVELVKRTSSYLDFLPPQEADRGVTWSYFGPWYFGLDPQKPESWEDIKAFKATVLHHIEHKKPELSDCVSISIGQTQARQPLNHLLAEVVGQWRLLGSKERSEEAALGRLQKYFDLQIITVPNPLFDGRSAEKTLQVLLKPDYAAHKLLLPKLSLNQIENQQQARTSSTNTPAAQMFKELLEAAKTEMHLNEDVRWQTNPPSPYVPLPLVTRILGIVHRLLPEECYVIPLSVDGQRPEWIYLPRGIRPRSHPKTDGRDEDELYRRILANYVLGCVLNRAMAAGLRYAELDLGSMAPRAKPEPEERRRDEMSPEDWQECIVEDLYKKGGYEDLIGRYLRDFNTPRSNLAFRTRLAREPQSADGTAGALPVGRIQDDLNFYLRANKLERLWLLGIDIGGTLTKCQIYSFRLDGVGFEPLGKVFHTATKLPEETRRKLEGKEAYDRAKEATAAFAGRVIRLVSKHGPPEMWNSPLSRVVIGITWPGPVCDNHIAGTSGSLEQFGLSRQVDRNAIEDIWRVDLVDAMRKEWEQAHRAKPDFVLLLNDGDADAVGAVIQSAPEGGRFGPELAGSRLAVIKLGTGLAGAVLDLEPSSITLRPGLFEWGKLILDVGPTLRSEFRFPNGVAADYLSKRCLPQLSTRPSRPDEAATKAAGGQFRADDSADSAEVGLIVETKQQSEDPTEAYGRLIVECAAIQAERRPPFGFALNADVYRVLYYQPDAEPDLVYELRLALRVAGELKDILQRHVRTYGKIRLQRLIGELPVSEEQNESAISDEKREQAFAREAAAVVNAPSFMKAAAIAEAAVTTLGHYLGDFCVTLHDQLEVDVVRLTGGVLSGETGRLAKKAAQERVTCYGLQMDSQEKPDTFCLRKQEDAGGVSRNTEVPTPMDPRKPGDPKAPAGAPPQIERGALGAACCSAAAWIQERKQEGLHKLRVKLASLPSGAVVTIRDGMTEVDKEAWKDLLTEHGLQNEDVLRFLRQRGLDLRMFESEGRDFVKW